MAVSLVSHCRRRSFTRSVSALEDRNSRLTSPSALKLLMTEKPVRKSFTWATNFSFWSLMAFSRTASSLPMTREQTMGIRLSTMVASASCQLSISIITSPPTNRALW